MTIEVGAGKNWHELVQETLAQNWFGLENLSLIPDLLVLPLCKTLARTGRIAEHLVSVDVVRADGAFHKMSAADCEFGYRDGIFKRQAMKVRTLLILGLLRLSKRPAVNLSYSDLSQVFGQANEGSAQPSPQQVADAVVTIRRGKLPDLGRNIPMLGAFSKSGARRETADRLHELRSKPYPFNEGFKVSAAQLIDLSGWKGRGGDVGCWPQQPLVLINYGQATAQNVLDFANDIRRSVYEKFQVELERSLPSYPDGRNCCL